MFHVKHLLSIIYGQKHYGFDRTRTVLYTIKKYQEETMKSIKGTKTEKNLKEAFAGESQARNKYTFYASQAKKDGLEQISAIFTETADNEKEHAKMWFKELNGGSVPATYTNLLEAAAGEHGEWTDMYKKMADDARKEGFEEIAQKFEGVSMIEKRHEERYIKIAEMLKANKTFKKSKKTMWICRNCGHIHFENSAPTTCPVCTHPQSYFQILSEEF